jgi:hypothetical protein
VVNHVTTYLPPGKCDWNSEIWWVAGREAGENASEKKPEKDETK